MDDDEGTDFASGLRELMRSWGWEEWRIRRDLPRVLAALEGVGILERVDDAYVVTPLAASEEAWKRAQALLEEEGIGGRAGG